MCAGNIARPTSLRLLCPRCGQSFGLPDEKAIKDIEGCTVNCYWCQTLLLIENGCTLDFHATIHAKDKRWPIDGKGARYIEV